VRHLVVLGVAPPLVGVARRRIADHRHGRALFVASFTCSTMGLSILILVDFSSRLLAIAVLKQLFDVPHQHAGHSAAEVILGANNSARERARHTPAVKHLDEEGKQILARATVHRGVPSALLRKALGMRHWPRQDHRAAVDRRVPHHQRDGHHMAAQGRYRGDGLVGPQRRHGRGHEHTTESLADRLVRSDVRDERCARDSVDPHRCSEEGKDVLDPIAHL